MNLSFVYLLVAGILTTPAAAVPLVHVGDSPTTLLGECQSDCDSDADCADGLVCYFRRSGFNEDIPPGCETSSAADGLNRDFCYDRDSNYPHTANHYGFAWNEGN